MQIDNALKITPQVAREALYRIEGMIASDDGMIIENAITIWEEREAEYTETLAQVEEWKNAFATATNESEINRHKLNQALAQVERLEDRVKELLNANSYLVDDSAKLDQAIESLKQVSRLATTGNHTLIKGLVRDTLQLIGGDEEDAST